MKYKKCILFCKVFLYLIRCFQNKGIWTKIYSVSQCLFMSCVAIWIFCISLVHIFFSISLLPTSSIKLTPSVHHQGLFMKPPNNNKNNNNNNYNNSKISSFVGKKQNAVRRYYLINGVCNDVRIGLALRKLLLDYQMINRARFNDTTLS